MALIASVHIFIRSGRRVGFFGMMNLAAACGGGRGMHFGWRSS